MSPGRGVGAGWGVHEMLPWQLQDSSAPVQGQEKGDTTHVPGPTSLRCPLQATWGSHLPPPVHSSLNVPCQTGTPPPLLIGLSLRERSPPEQPFLVAQALQSTSVPELGTEPLSALLLFGVYCLSPAGCSSTEVA